MALNIIQPGGDYDPYVKYNAKSGKFYLKDDVEVLPTEFLADLANIKTGWLKFVAGMAPSRVWDESLTRPADRPHEDYKRGFSLRLMAKTTFGGVVELSGSSMHLCGAINDLYEAAEKQFAANPGKVPVIKFNGTSIMKDKQGMNYKPNFVLDRWVDAPPEFSGYEETKAAPQAAAVQSSVSEF